MLWRRWIVFESTDLILLGSFLILFSEVGDFEVFELRHRVSVRPSEATAPTRLPGFTVLGESPLREALRQRAGRNWRKEGNVRRLWSFSVYRGGRHVPASCPVLPAERLRTTACPPFQSQAPCSGGESCWDCCLPLWPPGQDRASRRGDKNRTNDGARSSPI